MIRMQGLGDVASILVPAVRLLRQRHPGAAIDALTFDAGVEVMALMPEVNAILAVTKEQWPDSLLPAIDSFLQIGETVVAQNYDLILNLDTWFMPCFLASALLDHGLNVQGNTLTVSVAELYDRLRQGSLTQKFFSDPATFMASSFPNMAEWFGPWWERHPGYWGYADFYLGHCCQFGNVPLDMHLDVAADEAFRQAAGGRKIVALSMSGSKPAKRYKQTDELRRRLQQAGFLVWSQFDGSLPMAVTLGRLKVTDLLVGVATSAQWLARSVGCPALILSGSLPPLLPGPEIWTDPVESCQYCCQMVCPRNLDFPCQDVPVDVVVDKAVAYLRG